MVKYTETEVVFAEIPDEVTLAINISNCPHNCKGCHSPYLRQDIGNILTEDVLDSLIEKNEGITCVCFMGEGKEPMEIYNLGIHIKEKYPELKIGIYTGGEDIDDFFYGLFDYIKIGPYIEELGPLNKKTTNQRLYKLIQNIHGYVPEDITEKFWKEDKTK